MAVQDINVNSGYKVIKTPRENRGGFYFIHINRKFLFPYNQLANKFLC